MAYRAMFYCLVYLNTLIWPLLTNVINYTTDPSDRTLFALRLLSWTLYPLQGFFNLLVFTSPIIKELQKQHQRVQSSGANNKTPNDSQNYFILLWLLLIGRIKPSPESLGGTSSASRRRVRSRKSSRALTAAMKGASKARRRAMKDELDVGTNFTETTTIVTSAEDSGNIAINNQDTSQQQTRSESGTVSGDHAPDGHPFGDCDIENSIDETSIVLQDDTNWKPEQDVDEEGGECHNSGSSSLCFDSEMALEDEIDDVFDEDPQTSFVSASTRSRRNSVKNGKCLEFFDVFDTSERVFYDSSERTIHA